MVQDLLDLLRDAETRSERLVFARADESEGSDEAAAQNNSSRRGCREVKCEDAQVLQRSII